jgi:small subunit ribosomal protein S5
MYNLKWEPKTKQGILVKDQKIINLKQYFQEFIKIPESEILDLLEPNSSYILISKRRVQRTTKSGKQPSFSVLVAIGNYKDCIGLAFGKSKQLKSAILKGIVNAKKKTILLNQDLVYEKVKEIVYKHNKIIYRPGYKGMGIVAGGKIKDILKLSGIKDIWVNIYGSMNPINYTLGIFEILKDFKV